jgi:hypothetical protein
MQIPFEKMSNMVVTENLCLRGYIKPFWPAADINKHEGQLRM